MPPRGARPGKHLDAAASRLLSKGRFTDALAHLKHNYGYLSRANPYESILATLAMAFCNLQLKSYTKCLQELSLADITLSTLGMSLSQQDARFRGLLSASLLYRLSGPSLSIEQLDAQVNVIHDDIAAVTEYPELFAYLLPKALCELAYCQLDQGHREKAQISYSRLASLDAALASPGATPDFLIRGWVLFAEGLLLGGPQMIDKLHQIYTMTEEAATDPDVDRSMIWLSQTNTINSILSILLDDVSPYDRKEKFRSSSEHIKNHLGTANSLTLSLPQGADQTTIEINAANVAQWEARYLEQVGDHYAAMKRAEESEAHSIRAFMMSSETHNVITQLFQSKYLSARLKHVDHLRDGASSLEDVDRAFAGALDVAQSLAIKFPADSRKLLNVWRVWDDWADVARAANAADIRLALYTEAIRSAGNWLTITPRLPTDADLRREMLDRIVNSTASILGVPAEQAARLQILNTAIEAISKLQEQESLLRGRSYIELLKLASVFGLGGLVNPIAGAPLASWPSTMQVSEDYNEFMTMERRWPCDYLVPGDWAVLERAEASRVFDALARDLSHTDAPGGFEKQQGRIICIAKLRLCFYDDWQLFEFILRSDDERIAVLDALIRDGETGTAVLDGNSRWIHMINTMHPPNFSLASQVGLYCDFFCGCLRGEQARFVVLNSAESGAAGPIEADLKNLTTKQDNAITSDADGLFRTTRVILYNRNVFSSNLVITAGGRVVMSDDEPIMASIDIVPEAFDGAWRIGGRAPKIANQMQDRQLGEN